MAKFKTLKAFDYVLCMDSDSKSVNVLTRRLEPDYHTNIRFVRGEYETNDPKIIEYIMKHPDYGQDFTLVPEHGKELEAQKVENEIKETHDVDVDKVMSVS